MIINEPLITHDILQSRYIFAGTLELATGLHIGSGQNSLRTDAAIIRNADGVPYIPGSSFKGALRSSVERIACNIPEITSCQLLTDSSFPCLTSSKESQKKLKEIHELVELSIRTGKSLADYRDNNKALLEYLLEKKICSDMEIKNPDFSDKLPFQFIEAHLCHTCRIFGSTFFAAKIRIADLAIQGEWYEQTEIRDCVAIDRDTETAVTNAKFDLEVLPAGITFDFHLEATNLNNNELGLLCIGLQEFRQGRVPLGGGTTRGLGSNYLHLSHVNSYQFNEVEDIIEYLINGNASSDSSAPKSSHEKITSFFKEKISWFALTKEKRNAEKAP